MGLPNIQTAQYGDRVKLEKLGATRMTDNPATEVQTMKGEGGRPEEWSSFDPIKYAQKAIQGGGRGGSGATGEPQLSPQEQEHQRKLNSLAQLYATAMKWTRIAAQPGAGEFTKSYALNVLRIFKEQLHEVRANTPFFDGM